MAEETITRTIRKIAFSYFDLNQQEVIDAFQDQITSTSTHNETIPSVYFQLFCFDGDSRVNFVPFNFSETLEMRNMMVENSIHIERFEIVSHCQQRNEYFAWFDFFVRLIRACNNCETKHFEYFCLHRVGISPRSRMVTYQTYHVHALSLERANELANAILLRSNNKKNDSCIETFRFEGYFVNNQVFQPVWNALLDVGVRELTFHFRIPRNGKMNDTTITTANRCIDSTRLSTYTTLKRLRLIFDSNNQRFDVSLTHLFHAIKVNNHQGLEELRIETYKGNFPNDRENIILSFKEMLRVNITLLIVQINAHLYDGHHDSNVRDDLLTEIDTETKINRDWKRVIKKHKERAAATAVNNTAAVAAATTTDTNGVVVVAAAIADDATDVTERRKQDEIEKKIKEEKKMMKKKEEMVICLKLFHKPLMRNELIYHFLTENADMFNVR